MLPIEAQKYKWKDSSMIAKLRKLNSTFRHVNTHKCNSNPLCYCESCGITNKNKKCHNITYFGSNKSSKAINCVGIVGSGIKVC